MGLYLHAIDDTSDLFFDRVLGCSFYKYDLCSVLLIIVLHELFVEPTSSIVNFAPAQTDIFLGYIHTNKDFISGVVLSFFINSEF
jgi:hypothetical protein